MDVTVPTNTTATVYVPARDAASVTESGTAAVRTEGVKCWRMENGCAVFAVGAGVYRFERHLPTTQGP
jgi:alpha-L-rhamnosidase